MAGRHTWWAALGCVAVLGVSTTAPGQEAGAQGGKSEHVGRAFIFRADLQAARARGHIGADVADDVVLDRVAKTLTKRLRSTSRFVEAQVTREKDHRFAVTFFGPMDARIESFLIAGLTNSGDMSCRILVEDADLVGTDLKTERQRLAAWRAEHAKAPLEAYNALPHAKGGPDGQILWLPRPSADGDAAPTAVVRERVHRFRRADMSAHVRIVRNPKQRGRVGLAFPVRPEQRGKLRIFGERHRKQEIAFVINGEIVQVRERGLPFSGRVTIDANMSPQEARALLLAVTGGVLDVPLVFVERAKRPLKIVAPRGKPPSESAPKAPGQPR